MGGSGQIWGARGRFERSWGSLGGWRTVGGGCVSNVGAQGCSPGRAPPQPRGSASPSRGKRGHGAASALPPPPPGPGRPLGPDSSPFGGRKPASAEWAGATGTVPTAACTPALPTQQPRWRPSAWATPVSSPSLPALTRGVSAPITSRGSCLSLAAKVIPTEAGRAGRAGEKTAGAVSNGPTPARVPVGRRAGAAPRYAPLTPRFLTIVS